jgi:hypothetical protein
MQHVNILKVASQDSFEALAKATKQTQKQAK